METQAIAVYCSDYRFVTQTYEFLQDKHPRSYDQVVLPGSSGGITNYEDWREAFLSQLALLVQLHKPRVLYLIDHEDCGVYKKIYGDSYYRNHMLSLHQMNLREIMSLIKSLYPHLMVKRYLILLTGITLEFK